MELGSEESYGLFCVCWLFLIGSNILNKVCVMILSVFGEREKAIGVCVCVCVHVPIYICFFIYRFITVVICNLHFCFLLDFFGN